MATLKKFALVRCAAFVLLATGLSAQQHTFDGNWQMVPAKSHLNDNRTVTLVIATVGQGIKMTMTAHKDGSDEIVSEFLTKLDGKACDFTEGSHKSRLTMWFDGSSLGASKEGGPATDVTSMWKIELSADKRTLTMTINHYEPTADDETLVFAKAST